MNTLDWGEVPSVRQEMSSSNYLQSLELLKIPFSSRLSMVHGAAVKEFRVPGHKEQLGREWGRAG